MPRASAKQPKTQRPRDIVLRTQPEVAAFFNRPADTIRNWVKCGMPGSAGAYSVKAIGAWLGERYGDRWDTKSGQDRQRKLAAEAEKLELANERARFSMERARGDWVSKSAVQREVSEALILMREELGRVAPGLRAILPPELVESVTRNVHSRLELAQKAWCNRMLGLESLESPTGESPAAEEPGEC